MNRTQGLRLFIRFIAIGCVAHVLAGRLLPANLTVMVAAQSATFDDLAAVSGERRRLVPLPGVGVSLPVAWSAPSR
jgi:hypothetical protein